MPFVLFNILPILFGVYVSFTEWSIIGAPEWVGLGNYRDALHDPWLRVAFTNIFFYAVIIVPGVVALGLAFALFVNDAGPLKELADVANVFTDEAAITNVIYESN